MSNKVPRGQLTRRTLLAAGASTAFVAAFFGSQSTASEAGAATTWRHPFTFRGGVSPGQGWNGNAHKGLDYGYGGVGEATPIYAIGAGKVVYAGWDTYYDLGNRITIEHANGIHSNYGHLLNSSISVSSGQQVGASQFIGRVGNTGYSFGNHLHVEMWANSNRATHFDPYPHIHMADLALPGVPLPPKFSEDVDMYFQATTNSADGLIKVGYLYVNNADGPLRALSNLESIAVTASAPFIANFGGEDIRTLVKIVGLREQGAPQPLTYNNGAYAVLNSGRHTGNIVY